MSGNTSPRSVSSRRKSAAFEPPPPPIPSLKDTIKAWKKQGENYHHLEDGFINSSINLGGAICESFENRIENIRRTTNTIIPTYNAMADPHLKGFRKRWAKLLRDADAFNSTHKDHFVRSENSQTAQGALKASSTRRNRDASPDILPVQKETSVDLMGVGGPCSTRHVLALKQLFWRWAKEYRAVVAQHLPSGSDIYANTQKVRVVNVQEVNFHALVHAGIAVTNSQFRLHQRLLLPAPSMPLLYDWLVLLGCTEVVDWPAFLVLCCANMETQWASMATIRNNYDCFLQQRPIKSEKDFHELLAFLHYNSTSASDTGGGGGDHTAEKNGTVSFFQPGDFFKARNINSFPETVLSLMPHSEQFYISKAKGQGQSMTTNFCGHTCVVDEKTASHSRPSTASTTRRNFLKKEVLTKRDAEFEQAKRTRFNKRVWC